MAAASGRGRQHNREQAGGDKSARPAGKRRRWRLLAIGALLLAVVGLLPTIVSHTPLLNWLLAAGTTDLKGTVTVRSASLSWFSPLAAEGIEIRDAQGEPVLEAARLTGQKSLAEILSNWSVLGQFQLAQPKLTLRLRDDGSNVEDVLAEYLTADEEPSGQVSVSLAIRDGSVLLIDETNQTSRQIEDVQLHLALSPGSVQVTNLDASGKIVDVERSGQFTVALTSRQGGESGQQAGAAGQMTAQVKHVPLAMFNALVGRWAPQTQLSGRLRGEISAQWDTDGTTGTTALQADVDANDLTVAAEALGTDRVHLSQLHATCRIARQGDLLEIKQSSLDCDLGHASIRGTLDLSSQESRPLLASLLHQTQEISGRVDLAQLAQMLPRTLCIRQGTEITAGQVQWSLSSQLSRQGMLWQATIDAKDLTGVHQGRTLTWQKPIRVRLTAHEGEQAPVLDSLLCESDFLTLNANGTPGNLTASGSFHLQQLVEQLGQFVDLSDVQLAGEGSAHLNWQRSENGQFKTTADLNLQQFRLTMPQWQPWVEEHLRVVMSANGRTDFGSDNQLQAASLEIITGSDRLQAQLTESVADFRNGTWPVSLQMQGRVAAWPSRLRTWISSQQWQAGGNYQLSAQAIGSADAIEVAQAALTLTQFELQTPQLNVHEPRIELAVSGRYQRPTKVLQLARVEFRSGTLGANATGQITQADDQTDVQLDGQIHYDLEKLTGMLPEDKARWIRAAGRGASPVSYRGPLVPAKAQATAGLCWDWAHIYGFDVGPGELQAKLADGTVQVEPLDLLVSQGHLLLAPQLRLAPEPAELTLPAGPLATQVQISREMCASWLKYIAPVVADVTTAQGGFSIELDNCRIPLDDPAEGDLAGRLTVHSVRIGPGPLLDELAVLVGPVQATELRRESVVPFRMVDGRVYHKNLELVFPDLTIRTEGWVGLDQQLSILAEMPVPPKWIGNNPLGAALQNQTIRLPIGGTLEKPRIDRTKLRELSRQFIRDATRNFLEEGLEGPLRQLFGPPR
jgi:hypothetical protein